MERRQGDEIYVEDLSLPMLNIIARGTTNLYTDHVLSADPYDVDNTRERARVAINCCQYQSPGYARLVHEVSHRARSIRFSARGATLTSQIFYVSKFSVTKLPQKCKVINNAQSANTIEGSISAASHRISRKVTQSSRVKRAIIKVLPTICENMDTPLMQLGGDSLTLEELSSSIKDATGLHISVIDLFDLKTANAIVGFITEMSTST